MFGSDTASCPVSPTSDQHVDTRRADLRARSHDTRGHCSPTRLSSFVADFEATPNHSLAGRRPAWAVHGGATCRRPMAALQRQRATIRQHGSLCVVTTDAGSHGERASTNDRRWSSLPRTRRSERSPFSRRERSGPGSGLAAGPARFLAARPPSRPHTRVAVRRRYTPSPADRPGSLSEIGARFPIYIKREWQRAEKGWNAGTGTHCGKRESVKCANGGDMAKARNRCKARPFRFGEKACGL